MDDIVKIVEKFIVRMKDEINESYEKSTSYINDLIISKKVNIMLDINSEPEEIIRKTILAMINATNSALTSIGVSTDNLSSNNELFRESFEENRNMYSNYNSFLQLGLKDYVNSHLFVIFLEYLTNIDKIKMENLDLFDLLPREFINKLNQFKNEIQISEDAKNRFKFFITEIWKYFDSSNLTFKLTNFEMKESMDATSEADILKMLQEARMDNINALKQIFSRTFRFGKSVLYY
jgi:predicted nucleotidyltransferase